jgi:probable biosynthetic protein (TIGR04098 family)
VLKLLGHLRWLSFERLAGVPTAKVADTKGRRLYATFYYIDIHYPLSAPANAFRENDRVAFLGDFSAYGRNILDGYFALYRAGDSREGQFGVPTAETRESFTQAGIPYIRLSNIFIQQEQGPEKLRIGQPSNADFTNIPAIREAPEGHERNREAREAGHFFPHPAGTRVHELTFDYSIDPDRDVNAAGLVYFANFPAFFEVAERRALASLKANVPRDFVNRRGTLRRQVGFFGNARTDDTLVLHVRFGVSPETLAADSPSRPHGAFWFSTFCHRGSDQTLIAITTVLRVVPLLTEGEVAQWNELARAVNTPSP